MQELLHTPEGVRDIYQQECARKQALQQRLLKVLHMFGYHDIQTPTFEFFDVFRKEIGTIPSKELYKFFDKEGNTLVLRPDMTPQIARFAATILNEDDFPARLSYVGNTFINHNSYRGRLKEQTQLGVELLGMEEVEADAEMLAMVVECVKKAGLEEFQITVGNANFFHSMIADANLDSEKEQRLRELVSNRNYFGVDELLTECEVRKSTREAFSVLSDLVGGVEILDEAKRIAPNEKAHAAVTRLEQLYQLLEYYKVDKYISFDLSMSGLYGYYTGIVFRAYTFGSGDAIVKGGRYNHLLEKFGREMPAIGFAVSVDELMNALSRQKITLNHGRKNTLIIYDADRQREAITLVKEFHNKEKHTELIKKDPNKTIQYYMEYGHKKMASSMLYLQDNRQILMTNLITGEQKIVKSRD